MGKYGALRSTTMKAWIVFLLALAPLMALAGALQCGSVFSSPMLFTTPTESSEELSRRLRSVIENKFSFGFQALVEGHVFVPSRKENAFRLAAMGRLWDEARPDEDFIRQLKDGASEGSFSTEFTAKEGRMRAKLKTMRFICQALCEDESKIDRLNELTVVLGHLDDAGKFGSNAQVREQIERLEEALSKSALRQIDIEVKKARAVGRKELSRKIREMVDSMRETIRAPEISVTEFHEVRKNLGRLQTLVLMNAVVGGEAAEKSSYESFRKLYDRIGAEHDDMVKAEFGGASERKVSFGPILRKEIEAALAYFEI